MESQSDWKGEHRESSMNRENLDKQSYIIKRKSSRILPSQPPTFPARKYEEEKKKRIVAVPTGRAAKWENETGRAGTSTHQLVWSNQQADEAAHAIPQSSLTSILFFLAFSFCRLHQCIRSVVRLVTSRIDLLLGPLTRIFHLNPGRFRFFIFSYKTRAGRLAGASSFFQDFEWTPSRNKTRSRTKK